MNTTVVTRVLEKLKTATETARSLVDSSLSTDQRHTDLGQLLSTLDTIEREMQGMLELSEETCATSCTTAHDCKPSAPVKPAETPYYWEDE